MTYALHTQSIDLICCVCIQFFVQFVFFLPAAVMRRSTSRTHNFFVSGSLTPIGHPIQGDAVCAMSLLFCFFLFFFSHQRALLNGIQLTRQQISNQRHELHLCIECSHKVCISRNYAVASDDFSYNIQRITSSLPWHLPTKLFFL